MSVPGSADLYAIAACISLLEDGGCSYHAEEADEGREAQYDRVEAHGVKLDEMVECQIEKDRDLLTREEETSGR